MYTDIVTLGQGDRGMVEFKYPFPGQFMFHAHINHFSDLGWIGFFNVTAALSAPSQIPITTTSPSLSSLAGGQPSQQEVPNPGVFR